uniref:RNase H type-1 domain-containing protein n=1 Tax=Cannabis sativa TaxID=3483 RepID=A0A803QK92_CANSA
MRSMLAANLDMQIVECHTRYLGHSAYVGQRKKEVFESICTKIQNKLQGWKAGLFSQAGWEVLLKVVTQEIPCYVMRCFRLPKELIKHIHSMMAQFWWGTSDTKQKIHWEKWNKLCKAKIKGGMGLKDLTRFNKALLAKQGWKIIQNPQSMLGSVLKACDFSNGSFLEAKPSGFCSYVWQSILWGKELIRQGLCWRVKLGRMKIDSIFHEDDVPIVLGLAPCTSNADDDLVWDYSPNGIYSVSSGYKIADMTPSKTESSSCQNMEKWWNKLYGIWRSLRRSVISFSAFVRVGFRLRLLHQNIEDPIIILFEVHRKLARGEVAEQLHNCNTSNPLDSNLQLANRIKWENPHPGYVCINSDASVPKEGSYCGLGVVIRDHHGKVIAAAIHRLKGHFNVELAESLALHLGLQLAEKIPPSPFIIQTDCLRIVQYLNGFE